MGSLALSPETGVVVTGGASGIGRATAQALADIGRPVALWDRNEEGAARAAEEIKSSTGVATLGIGIDVTDSHAIASAVERTRATLGSIGGLCHSAGTVSADALGSLDDASWAKVLDVNLRAHALITQALLPALRDANPGSAVVGIASIEALIGHGAIPAYCASKAGLLGLTRSMADQLAPEGIRVNAVCPGYIDTPLLAPTPPMTEWYVANAPMKRLGQPDDIAKVVRFLLSDEAGFVTGTQIVVDGGVTAVD